MAQRPIYDRLRSTLEPYQAIGVDKLLQIADSLDPSKSTQATRPIYERLQSKLEPYQAIGVDKLLEIANSGFQGAILGDATGLGKSLPALLAALLLREQAGNHSFVLVVTKPALVSQWESEIARHFKPVCVILIVEISFLAYQLLSRSIGHYISNSIATTISTHPFFFNTIFLFALAPLCKTICRMAKALPAMRLIYTL